MALARVPHIPGGTSQDIYAGLEFSHAVGPSVPLRGVVKDFDSGVPIPVTLVFVERLFQGKRMYAPLRLDANHIRAKTDENGKFQLTTFEPGDGAVKGEHQAIVIPSFPRDTDDMTPQERRRARAPIDRRFKEFETSRLRFTVTDDASQNHFKIEVWPPRR